MIVENSLHVSHGSLRGSHEHCLVKGIGEQPERKQSEEGNSK